MNISQSNTEKQKKKKKTILQVKLGVGFKAAGSVDSNWLTINVLTAPLK